MWSAVDYVRLSGSGARGLRYHPLYGEHGTDNASVVDELALIHIEAIPDRVGQQMYNSAARAAEPLWQTGAGEVCLRASRSRRRGELVPEGTRLPLAPI